MNKEYIKSTNKVAQIGGNTEFLAFDETVPECICGCGRSLEKFHKNRLVHPNCENEWDKIRRQKRQSKNKGKRRQQYEEFKKANPNFIPISAVIARAVRDAGGRCSTQFIIEMWRTLNSMEYPFVFVEDFDESLENIAYELVFNIGKSKFNNNMRTFMADDIEEVESELKGFFVRRRKKNIKR